MPELALAAGVMKRTGEPAILDSHPKYRLKSLPGLLIFCSAAPRLRTGQQIGLRPAANNQFAQYGLKNLVQI